MIMINVKFPETNHEYDFKADEMAPIDQVIDEMVVMIAEQEHIKLSRTSDMFILCNPKTEEMLAPLSSLAMNGITSGMTLCLV